MVSLIKAFSITLLVQRLKTSAFFDVAASTRGSSNMYLKSTCAKPDYVLTAIQIYFWTSILMEFQLVYIHQRGQWKTILQLYRSLIIGRALQGSGCRANKAVELEKRKNHDCTVRDLCGFHPIVALNSPLLHIPGKITSTATHKLLFMLKFWQWVLSGWVRCAVATN